MRILRRASSYVHHHSWWRWWWSSSPPPEASCLESCTTRCIIMNNHHDPHNHAFLALLVPCNCNSTQHTITTMTWLLGCSTPSHITCVLLGVSFFALAFAYCWERFLYWSPCGVESCCLFLRSHELSSKVLLIVNYLAFPIILILTCVCFCFLLSGAPHLLNSESWWVWGFNNTQ